MKDLVAEYEKLMVSTHMAQVSEAVIEKHTGDFARFAAATGSAVTIFDNVARRTIYRSESYLNLFGTEENKIHPEDYEAVFRGAVIAMRYFFNGNRNVGSHRLLRRYRALVKGEYRVVNEQVQPLEIDTEGNVLLSFDIVELAPNQSPPHVVESRILNFRTGDIITPADTWLDGKPILTRRELEILREIDRGLLSKEIAAKLSISVHTVNTHRQRILEKLQVGTSIEAVRYASALGVL